MKTIYEISVEYLKDSLTDALDEALDGRFLDLEDAMTIARQVVAEYEFVENHTGRRRWR